MKLGLQLCLQLCFCSSAGFLQCLVRVLFGCLAAVACGMLYAAYLSAYHDRKFWFSTRQVGDFSFLFLHEPVPATHLAHSSKDPFVFVSQELEREISFQGGSGLYYYYYKHMLAAPSFERGISVCTLCFL